MSNDRSGAHGPPFGEVWGEKKICQDCGHENSPDATACAKCGKPLLIEEILVISRLGHLEVTYERINSISIH